MTFGLSGKDRIVYYTHFCVQKCIFIVTQKQRTDDPMHPRPASGLGRGQDPSLPNPLGTVDHHAFGAQTGQAPSIFSGS